MTGRSPGDARVLLMGMMGCGKTTVGTALSARTGWSYLDNDELVHRAAGEATPDILRDRGEEAMRAAESAALTVALGIPPPVIAAVAGGIVEDAADRERLRSGGFVVFLRARLSTLVDRVGSGEGRPWLQPDPAAALARLYRGREELYRQAASLILDVDEASPDELAGAILDELAAGTR